MYPTDLKYHPGHTWLSQETDNKVRIGITFYAQEQLQEVIFVELPESGTEVIQSQPFGVIESRKTAYDLYSPVSGVVVDVNHRLELEPNLVNREPYGAGWMMVVEISEPSQLDALMEADEYESSVEEAY